MSAVEVGVRGKQRSWGLKVETPGAAGAAQGPEDGRASGGPGPFPLREGGPDSECGKKEGPVPGSLTAGPTGADTGRPPGDGSMRSCIHSQSMMGKA